MFKTKKFISIILVVIMMLTFVGCSQSSGEEPNQEAEEPAENEGEAEEPEEEPEEPKEETKLDKIKEKGVIVLGTAADYPPYEFHKEINGEDHIVGFDIEIAKAFAEDLGVELEIKDMKFEGLIAALVADNIDFIVAGMVPKPERAEVIDFSIPYYQAEQSMLIKSEDVDKYTTPEDFEGTVVGAQKATVQEEIVLNQISGAEYKGLSKITDLVLELKNNKIEAVVLVKPVADAYANQNDDLIVPEISFGTEEGVAAAVNKGNTVLLAELNKTLEELIETGELDTFISEATLLADE
ncbi:MAG: transporter substrate-binding domain-containing protein [Bacillota bacterium]|nr:transporter substrate-binding domain-containing protein [Bacillota bacterium]